MRSESFCVFVWLFASFVKTHGLNTIWAVNCGGDAHIDVNGVSYAADFNSQGIASDYGLRLVIHRAQPGDEILYQTERYGFSTFYYEFPMPDRGSYVLHLKFSEVWFRESNQKVFSVELNGGLHIINDLDIFNSVGFSSAHDVNIPIQIKENTIYFDGSSVKLEDDEKFRVTFTKGPADNPKINAIALFANSLEDIPQLPPVFQYEPEQKIEAKTTERKPRMSTPPPVVKPAAPDPYASVDLTTYALPIAVTLIALVPVILCLCWM